MADEKQSAAGNEGEQKSIQPKKLYLKDVSFESPNAPNIFMEKWEPDLAIELSHSSSFTNEGLHEVVLGLTATVTVGDQTAYLAEVHQSGIFEISGYEQEQHEHIRSTYCNKFLYPYACAAISDLVSKGGFPQLLLAPLNFNQLYKNSLEEAESAETSPAED